jgi:hypothetical protein
MLIRNCVTWLAALGLVFGLGACGSDDDTKDGTGGSPQGPPGAISCGSASCSPGQVCCVPLTDGVLACADACESGTVSVACDGPEDCSAGACCGNVAAGYACTDAAACEQDVGQRCHGPDDCPSNTCLDVTFGGVPIDICQP